MDSCEAGPGGLGGECPSKSCFVPQGQNKSLVLIRNCLRKDTLGHKGGWWAFGGTVWAGPRLRGMFKSMKGEGGGGGFVFHGWCDWSIAHRRALDVEKLEDKVKSSTF